jgi:outer membrane biosynthesis protein TonB
MPDGAFQFDAPLRGKYRLRFAIWAHQPLITSDEDLEPTTERARKFSLSFHEAEEHRQYPDSAADAPPVPPLNERNHPKFPDRLYWKGIRNGEATADFLVDSAGTVLPGSLTVSSSTDQAFADELTRYLVSARFKPARLDRIPVCALMRDVRMVFHAGARSR